MPQLIRINLSAALFAATLPTLASNGALAQTNSLNDFAGRLDDQPSGTTIYTAREFITMDANRPSAEAIVAKLNTLLAHNYNQ